MNWVNRLQVVLSLICASVILSGCGATKINKDEVLEEASRVPVEEIEKSERPVASCNIMDDPIIYASSMVYIDSGGYPRNEALRLKINRLSADFENDSDYFIQFFRWRAEGSLAPSIDSEALEFVFEVTSNRQKIEGTTNILSWSVLQEVAAGVNGLEATSPEHMLSKLTLRINLRDPKADYHAIKVVAYQHNPIDDSVAALGQVDSLIPAFYADPKDYSVQRNGQLRPMVLLKEHPFFSDLEAGLDPEYFRAAARNLCFSSVF